MFTRWDFTKDKMYTLAESSKSIVANLEDVLNVQVFLSSKIPPEMVGLVSDVKDLLAEFQAYGNRNFKLTYLDPSTDEKVADSARRLGVQEIQVQVIQKDVSKVQRAWLGVALEYASEKEVIPAVTSVQSLEYDLTSAIVKITSARLPSIGILQVGGPQVQGAERNRFNSLRTLIGSEFDAVSVNFEIEESIPDDLDALIISDTWGISDFGKYLIDQYLMRGGKIIWLVDGIQIRQGLQAFPTLPGIEDMMEKWGAKLDRRLLLDEKSARAGFQTSWGTLILDYPCWIRVLPKNFSKDFPVTSELESVTLQWASPMSAVEPDDASFTVEPVMFTSEKAWLMESPFNLDPTQEWSMANKIEVGSHPVAVHSKGIFPSHFAGEEPPEPIKPPVLAGKDEDEADDLVPDVEIPEQIEVGIAEGEILAVGSARFAGDEFLPRQDFVDNQIFLLNLIEYFGRGDKLIGIRSRGTTSSPLKADLTSAKKKTFKFLNILSIPILVILFGAARFVLKRARRVHLAARYARRGDSR